MGPSSTVLKPHEISFRLIHVPCLPRYVVQGSVCQPCQLLAFVIRIVAFLASFEDPPRELWLLLAPSAACLFFSFREATRVLKLSMAWTSPKSAESTLEALLRLDGPTMEPGPGWPLAILTTLDGDVLRGDLLRRFDGCVRSRVTVRREERANCICPIALLLGSQRRMRTAQSTLDRKNNTS